jgi:hypothetical protein
VPVSVSVKRESLERDFQARRQHGHEHEHPKGGENNRDADAMDVEEEDEEEVVEVDKEGFRVPASCVAALMEVCADINTDMDTGVGPGGEAGAGVVKMEAGVHEGGDSNGGVGLRMMTKREAVVVCRCCR